MSFRTRGVVASAAALLATLLAGCSETVTVDAPPASGADAASCQKLLADLPATVNGQDRRDVSSGDALAVAWGTPAITLVCGIGVPPGFSPGATCIRANGVDWYVPDDEVFPDDPHTDVTITAVGYRPVVQVFIPGGYRPEGLAATMTDIGTVVGNDLDFVKHCA